MSAGFQRQAYNPALWQVGIPTQGLVPSYTSAYVVNDPLNVGVTVGNFVFLADTNVGLNKAVQPLGVAGQQPVGIVLRANTTSSIDFYNIGFSTTIGDGLNVSVLQRGSVPVVVTQATAPNSGDVVGVNPTNALVQTWAVGTAAPTGFVATNFRIVGISGTWASGNLALATNTQNVGA